MNSPAPIAHGPLIDLHRSSRARMVTAHGWEFAAEFDGRAPELTRAQTAVGVADLSHLPKLQVVGSVLAVLRTQPMPADQSGNGGSRQPGHAWEVQSGARSNRLTQDSVLCAWLAEDQAVAISIACETSVSAIVQLLAGHGVSTADDHWLDITGHFAAFDLVGPLIDELLRQLTSIDVSARAFPPGHCAQTGVARIPTIMIRPTGSTLPRVQLWCAREYGQYLWETLLERARPLGGGALGAEAWRATF